MDIKNEVLYRIYFLFFALVLPVAILLFYKTIEVGIVDGPSWRNAGQSMYVEYRPIEAERGNIFSQDGSLLATSIPYFDLYMDPNSTGMKEEDFNLYIDSLAWCLATYVDPSYTPGGYKEFLIEKRLSGARYVPIKKKVSYAEKRFIEQFPLFNLGQMRGGFIARKRSERKRPFGLLAQRTIGYVREGAKPVGLEGYFNDVLGGEEGTQPMLCVDRANDIWMPIEDLDAVEPQSGDDIQTTIDVNLQDITEEALFRAVEYHDADWGTAMLMEVETGAIKAIANLGRIKEGWWETYNHAVGTAVEPGSTWKLASMMALLEDGFVELEDSVYLEEGSIQFYEETLEDATYFSREVDSGTVRQVFEMSSNVGVAKLVDRYYGRKENINRNEGAARYISRIKQFNLNLPVGIEIEGEANPYIKEAYSAEDNWSGTTLPWMSIGYELRVTPLQLLNFYNAVANGGRLMKPYLVSEIQSNGSVDEQFRPTVLKKSIASEQTIRQAQSLLEGVVERGTAYKLKSEQYRFAGKTGTAQINYKRTRRGKRVGGYQASFVGYFPADDPKYSCIVVINNPRKHGFYGSDVAGPVFREIADRCYHSILDLHEPFNLRRKPVLATEQLPAYDAGELEDMEALLAALDLEFFPEAPGGMGMLLPENDSLKIVPKPLPAKQVPDVVGLGLRDALYALENRGLQVKVSGAGRVIRQSLKPGTPVRGQVIWLKLG